MFAVEMASITLLSSVQNALVLEPMTVFGAGKYRQAMDAYVGNLALLQLIVFTTCPAWFFL